ncbi:MAG: IclR family transcriptional regulator [Thermoleophilaceae bacterium]
MLLTINSSGRVLDLFTVVAPEWGVTQVAGELGMSKSKAHSLLASLSDVGLLRRTDRGRYRLGWRLLGLNRVLTDTTDFRCQARPVLEALCGHFGETVHLGALDDGRIVYVDRIQGRGAAPIPVSATGSAMPAHATGVGKVLLAHLAPAVLDAVVERHGLPALTKRTITDVDDLRDQLALVRARGFAVDGEEAVPGISCVAARIVGVDGDVVAAISIAAPTGRMNARRKAFEVAVVRAGRYVSRQLRSPAGDATPVAALQ